MKGNNLLIVYVQARFVKLNSIGSG